MCKNSSALLFFCCLLCGWNALFTTNSLAGPKNKASIAQPEEFTGFEKDEGVFEEHKNGSVPLTPLGKKSTALSFKAQAESHRHNTTLETCNRRMRRLLVVMDQQLRTLIEKGELKQQPERLLPDEHLRFPVEVIDEDRLSTRNQFLFIFQYRLLSVELIPDLTSIDTCLLYLLNPEKIGFLSPLFRVISDIEKETQKYISASIKTRSKIEVILLYMYAELITYINHLLVNYSALFFDFIASFLITESENNEYTTATVNIDTYMKDLLKPLAIIFNREALPPQSHREEAQRFLADEPVLGSYLLSKQEITNSYEKYFLIHIKYVRRRLMEGNWPFYRLKTKK